MASLGVSCSIYGENYPVVISTLVPASVTPSIALSSTPLPTLFFMIPTYSTAIPYATASNVSTNAIVFIAQDWEHGGPSSLWVANIDGSGERKLVDIMENKNFRYNRDLQWSPDGKWIGYFSNDELWIISPDGSVNKKILSKDIQAYGWIPVYAWSPEGSKIAYITPKFEQQTSDGLSSVVVEILDLETGEISEEFSYKSSIFHALLWSPDGRYLLYTHNYSFSVYDFVAHKPFKGISNDPSCSTDYKGLSWSPNNKWFYNIQTGNGRYATTQICVAGLDGSSHQIETNGTTTSYPVWDKTGDFLYFVAANTDFDNTPLFDYDLRLMRYDPETQKQERLLSLGKEPRRWSVSISPDGQTLELHTIRNMENLVPFIFMDIQSLSVEKFSVNLKLPNTVAFGTGTAWASDNENIILFSGEISTPNGVGVQPYGFFYTLNIYTGENSVFSGGHNIELDEWAISPFAASP